MTKPLFSEHDFGARSIQMSRQYADVANVKHEAECPYKPRHDNHERGERPASENAGEVQINAGEVQISTKRISRTLLASKTLRLGQAGNCGRRLCRPGGEMIGYLEFWSAKIAVDLILIGAAFSFLFVLARVSK